MLFSSLKYNLKKWFDQEWIWLDIQILVFINFLYSFNLWKGTWACLSYGYKKMESELTTFLVRKINESSTFLMRLWFQDYYRCKSDIGICAWRANYITLTLLIRKLNNFCSLFKLIEIFWIYLFLILGSLRCP